MWILLILLSVMTIIYYPHWQRNHTIKRWDKALNVSRHSTHFQQLFEDINGFALSREARGEHDAIEYTYGEIDFISFIALLSLTKPHTDTVFYDLGSGTGKAVIACAMVFNVKKSCGVERFSLLNLTALKQQQRLKEQNNYIKKSQVIHFIQADFLTIDLTDATLIFINATAFFGDTWLAIQQTLKQVKIGAFIITTSKKLKSHEFILITTTRVQMSWGPVMAYIHQRDA